MFRRVKKIPPYLRNFGIKYKIAFAEISKSDEKAEQIASAAIKKYFVIDIDQEIKDYGLKIFVQRHGSDIFVDYNPESFSGNQTYVYDENKLKEATQKFLKDMEHFAK